jgi:carbon dioxide concentrating mechanism protein CcmN
VLTIPAPVHATHIQGDVHLDPQAVIAPGVCLIANPGSRIRVAAGVCLGLGTILHADGEGIVLETGVIVGAGVLLIGTVRVGAQACIGATSTVYNATIAPGQMIAPGSLCGDTGRGTTPAPPEPQPEPPTPAENATVQKEGTQANQAPRTVVGLQYFNQLRVTLRTGGISTNSTDHSG